MRCRISTQQAYRFEGPHSQNYLADYLIFAYATNCRVARIDRIEPVIAHYEHVGFGHLIRQRDIAIAESGLVNVGFVDTAVIHVHRPVVPYVNPIPRRGNDALHQHFVVVIKRNDVSLL